MIRVRDLEILQKYDMFRLTDLWIASGAKKDSHPSKFLKDPEIVKILKEIPDSVASKKGRYGGIYGSLGVAMAYCEWTSQELLTEFCKQTSRPDVIRSKTSKIPNSEEPLVPVTRLCEMHLEQFYWDKKSPQQMNLILAALGYQKEGKPFYVGHGKTVKQWELTKAGTKFGAEFTTLSGQRYVRWSVDILKKIKRG